MLARLDQGPSHADYHKKIGGVFECISNESGSLQMADSS